MENKCVYCGTSDDLSKSDIIPDALTNAKIINSNVCRLEHNNKFSDLFEDEVIKKLALITNELDIKSSKSKKYAPYSTEINVNGTAYNTKISSETEVFRNKKMRSVDGKFLFGPIDEIQKIKAISDKNLTPVDVNQIEFEKKVKFDLSVFFSESMYRLMAKIAFEWYCLHNSISGKVEAFEPIIQYITNGVGEDIVTIVGNENLYDEITSTMNFGSHVLISYVAKDNSMNILVSLFGIGVYNIKICNTLINGCESNIIFQELSLDTKRVQFKFDTFEKFTNDFYSRFHKIELEDGTIAMIPNDMSDTSLKYRLFYGNCYPLFQGNLQSTTKPTERIITLILKRLEDTLQSSALTLRGLKRFTKEHFHNLEEKVELNPKGTNKKAIFMFYLLLIIGRSNGAIKDLRDLNKVLKEKFSGEAINLSNDVAHKLNNEIFNTADYSQIILKGAKAIDSWNYE